MPNLYARQTALTNVGGRIDYISNPARQEHLLAVYDGAADLVSGAYWRQLAQECKAASKHATPGTKCVQGRELTIPLSNALLQKMEPEQIAEKMARSFEAKYGRPAMVAIHYNKTKTNLHAHLIYSERDLLQEPKEKVASRALYFDGDGKRHYKRAEILDEAGELRTGCRIVNKGEIYERRYFSAVDPAYSRKEWLRSAKREWLLPLRNGELKGDIAITEYDVGSGMLPQQHIGNAAPAVIREQIETYNRQVRLYNWMVENGIVPQKTIDQVQGMIRTSKTRNQTMRMILERFRALMDEWQQQEKMRAADEQRSIRVYKPQHTTQEKSVYTTRMNWGLQAKIDAVQGTDYARQNKQAYYDRKRRESVDKKIHLAEEAGQKPAKKQDRSGNNFGDR